MKPVVNLSDVTLRTFSHGEKFAVQIGEISEVLGLKRLGCTLHVVQPGKTAYPFHRHHGCDEMFLILSGAGEYRFGDERHAIKAGDCLTAPAGGSAHQILNSGSEELRYLGFSDNGDHDVVEYPDSGKISVKAGMKDGNLSTATFSARGRITPADYWDGE